MFFAMIALLSGCTEEVVMLPPVTENNLVDPSIQPHVLYSYPPDRGEGPFNIYSPGSGNAGYPHFILQFNKLILSSNILSTSVHCTGFSQPAVVRVIESGSYGTLALNVQAFTVFDSGSYRKKYYRVDRIYTITVDSTIHDINGNRLENGYTFSFRPEPYFRILDHFLSRDSVIALVDPWLRFNGPVDSQMFSSIEIVPRPVGTWLYETDDSLTVQFQPDSGFRMGTTYTLAVPEGAKDAAGDQLRTPLSIRFSTYPFSVSEYNYSVVGDTLTYLASPFEFLANGIIDTASFRSAFMIDPSVDATLSVFSHGCSFSPLDNFAPATRYVIRISNQLRSVYGDELSPPFEKIFTTRPFQISSTSPSGGSLNVPRNQGIRVSTNGRIDTATVRAAFSIVPRMSGRIESYSSEFHFFPDTLLPANTAIRVEISQTLQARGGYSLAGPYSFSFTTGAN